MSGPIRQWTFSIALLLTVALEPGAAFRMKRKGQKTDDTASSNQSSAEVNAGPENVLVARDIMLQRCMEERAADWTAIHKRMQITPSSIPAVEMLNALSQLKEATEKLEERTASRSWFKRLFNPEWRSSRAQKWRKQQADARELLKKGGFSLEKARQRCEKGMDETAYTCMEQKACPQGQAGCQLAKAVRARIDARDLQETKISFEKRFEESNLQRLIARYDDILSNSGYSWYTNKVTCRNELDATAKRMSEKIIDELSVGEYQGEDAVCGEVEGKFCPEGTYPTTSTRANLVARGASAGAVAYSLANVMLIPTMPGNVVVGAAALALGGPGAALIAHAAAPLLAGPIAAVVGYLATLGTSECACFPRTCEYNEQADMCELSSNTESPSGNPFSAKLPMVSMKCAPEYKTNNCRLAACGEADFSPTLLEPGSRGGGTSGLYGTVGRSGENGKGIYNCLSSTGTAAGALGFAFSLPSGEVDTPQARAQLLKRLAVDER